MDECQKKNDQPNPSLCCCANGTPTSPMMVWRWSGFLMTFQEEGGSCISTIRLLGQTMEIGQGTWEAEHDMTDMSWHHWTACRSRGITKQGQHSAQYMQLCWAVWDHVQSVCLMIRLSALDKNRGQLVYSCYRRQKNKNKYVQNWGTDDQGFLLHINLKRGCDNEKTEKELLVHKWYFIRLIINN